MFSILFEDILWSKSFAYWLNLNISVPKMAIWTGNSGIFFLSFFSHFSFQMIYPGSHGTVLANLFATAAALCWTKRYWCWLLLKESELTYCKNIPKEKSPSQFNSTGAWSHSCSSSFVTVQSLFLQSKMNKQTSKSYACCRINLWIL